MVTFYSEWTTCDGVTLVTAALTDVTGPTRVTIENRLDGPVWPPRSEGVPAQGWTDSGFEAVVGPGRHAFGYATPAVGADPAVELVEATPVHDADQAGAAETSAEAVCRDLGDPSPPVDALPSVTRNGDDATDGPSRVTESTSEDVPQSVGPFLETARMRVRTAETLAAAGTLDEATEAVRAAGGLDGVHRLAERAAADERALRTVARRAEALADRRADASIPTETLDRLA